MSNNIDAAQQALCDVSDGIGRTWAAWIAQLPAEQRRNLAAAFDEQGCRPGLRFIAGGPHRRPQITLLLVDRTNEFHTVAEVEFDDGPSLQ